MLRQAVWHGRQRRHPIISTISLYDQYTDPSQCSSSSSGHRRWLASRTGATVAQTGSWSSLSDSQKAAWTALGYTADSWEGKGGSPPPRWKKWKELNLEEQAAAKYGLQVTDATEWEALKPEWHSSVAASSPSTSSNSNRSSNALALIQDQEARLARQRQGNSSVAGTLGKFAYQAAKGLAPIVGPLLRETGRQGLSRSGSRGGGSAAGMAVVGSLLENLPAMVDSAGGKLDVTGIDTLIYLDDSGSMQGKNLQEGWAVLQSLESRLKKKPIGNDERFLPTRIVKFGSHATVLNPSEEEWSVTLVNTAWDGSSGGTYMWKMIEEDIQNRYRPAGGKLRVVVITDGYDVLSPPPYKGVRGCNPLMRTLLGEGYDIEWNIIVVGKRSKLSTGDERLYENLCRATGGEFLSLGSKGWDENDLSVTQFLDSVQESGYRDTEGDRRDRQKLYRLEACKGKREHFDWLPKLPAKKEDDDE